MDTFHSVTGAEGPYLDGEGRCPLPLPARLHPRLPPHSGDCALMALHHGLRFCSHRSFLRHRPTDEHAVGAACAHFPRCIRAGVEHLRPLCQLSLSARTQWLLWLQRPAATRIFCDCLCHGSFGNPHRYGDVAGTCEPFSALYEDLRRPTGSSLNALPGSRRVHRLYCGSCRPCCANRLSAQYEPHRSRNR